MIALLRKDLRIYRGAIVTAVVMICLPYIILTAVVVVQQNLHFDGFVLSARGTLSGLCSGAGIAVAAIFGGCAFAVERRDRSADFLAMMPVSRWSIILSKISIAFTAIFVVWIVHASIIFATRGDNFLLYLASGLDRREGAGPLAHEVFYFSYVVSAAGIVLTFGISWLMSVFLRSPSIAACVGLGVLMAFFVQTQIAEIFPSLYVLVAVAFGLGFFCFCLGTILYLERVGS
jgi:ABC-type transport system involved in multi-copper enzyme maturation permease subunit